MDGGEELLRSDLGEIRENEKIIGKIIMAWGCKGSDMLKMLKITNLDYISI